MIQFENWLLPTFPPLVKGEGDNKLHPLQHRRHALSAADAHGGKAVFCLFPLHKRGELAGDSRARRAQRVALYLRRKWGIPRTIRLDSDYRPFRDSRWQTVRFWRRRFTQIKGVAEKGPPIQVRFSNSLTDVARPSIGSAPHRTHGRKPMQQSRLCAVQSILIGIGVITGRVAADLRIPGGRITTLPSATQA